MKMRSEINNGYEDLRQTCDLFENLEDFEIDQLVQAMKEPIRTIDQCITKSRLRTLCIQLAAKNMALSRSLEKEKAKQNEFRLDR